jgi:hypothetical protein
MACDLPLRELPRDSLGPSSFFFDLQSAVSPVDRVEESEEVSDFWYLE